MAKSSLGFPTPLSKEGKSNFEITYLCNKQVFVAWLVEGDGKCKGTRGGTAAQALLMNHCPALPYSVA
jgi:hypothetical protein